jgi:hypothetical protein
MRRSIMTLGFIAGALFTAMVPGVASAQDSTQPPPPPPAGPPPQAPPPAAPSGSIMAPARNSDAPPLAGISVFGILGYGESIGFGGRYMLPIGIPSLLTHTRIRDSWAVEFGADLLYWSVSAFGANYHETELIPIAGVMWNVWLANDFAVYPKAELGFGFNVGSQNAYVGHTGIYPSGAAGLLYQVANGITLRAEIGSTGLRAGAGFFF